MEVKNKTIIFLGSSVTYGDGGYSMCESIAAKTDANAVKWAVSGTTLSTLKPNSYVERMMNLIDSQNVCDLFICQLSTNDAAQSIPLGEHCDSFDINDFDTDTVIGAIEFIITKAREKWNCPVHFYTGTFFKGPKYSKMVDALIVIAKKHNIGIIDLWNNKEMQNVSSDDYARYMRDNVHPTKLGYDEWWSPVFIDYIERL